MIDGDTLEARLAIWLDLTATETIRLLGVDTPERHGGTRAAGDAARTFTMEWLESRRGRLSVWACRRDSFGRLLCGITAEAEDRQPAQSLISAILQAGHGVAYEAGR